MKKFMIASGVAALVAGSAAVLTPAPAHASWAEGGQSGVAVYTGTDENKWRAERGRRGYSGDYDRGAYRERGYNRGPGVTLQFGGHRGYNDGYYYR